MYDGGKSEVLSATKLDENSDMTTTYLGRINMTELHKIKAEEKLPISEQGYAVGKLLDSTECLILLDMGVSKSFMSKSHILDVNLYIHYQHFHPKKQRIQVGNGQYVSVLFIIPIVIDIHGQRFEIITLVSEINENVDLVSGIKNTFELEGIIYLRESCFSFLNRYIPIFPKE